ncbi:hypothetical protein [Thermotoga sp.]|uniref:hypothetical protein n=1 Tax=Thermotoga sp. TaxID=28240 RepID=UPI0025EB90CF|nr:hypothetical protein [Thermotoga sp.]
MFEDILRSLVRGEITLEEAEEKILEMFYERTDGLMLDLERDKCQGFPEIVFASEKMVEHIIIAVEKLLERKGIAFVFHLDEEKKKTVKNRFRGYKIREAGRLLVVKTKNFRKS